LSSQGAAIMTKSLPKQSLCSAIFQRLMVILITLILFSFGCYGNAYGNCPQEMHLGELVVSQPAESEIAGGQAHRYQLMLTKGQFVHLMVEQKGIDLVAAMIDPEGKEIRRVDSAGTSQGPEIIYLIAKSSGSYRLEVSASEKGSAPGRYQAKIEELRNATAEDERRAAWHEAFAEGVNLRSQAKAESLQAAIGKYLEAMHYLGNPAAPAAEADTLLGLGEVYYLVGRRKEALDVFLRELSLRRAIDDRTGEVNTLNNIGMVYDSLGEKRMALDHYNQALPLRRAVGDRGGEAATLNNIGIVYDSLGEKQKALDYYNQALPLRRAAGDRSGEAATFVCMGRVYDSLGEAQKALDYYNQALPIMREAGDRRSEAITLNNIGLAHDSLGEKQKAFDYYNQALPIRREVGDRSGEATTLTNIGRIYDSLGETQKALDYYNQALPLRRAVGDRSGEAATLNNIGGAYQLLGDMPKALDYYNQSLILRKAVGDRSGEATTLNNIGHLYDSLGEMQKALEHYNLALPLVREVGERAAEAALLKNIGQVYNSLGDKQKALEHTDRSLQLLRAVNDRVRQPSVLYNLARIQRELGNPNEARSHFETLLQIVESLRSNVHIRELRDSYFSGAQKYYESYIGLLMDLHKQQPSAGFDAAALNASERARARSLLELLAEARADIRYGIDKSLLERERSLQQLLNHKSGRRIRLLSGKHLPEQADAVTKEIEALATELQNVEAQIRAANPRYNTLTQPKPLTYEEVQQQLDPDTLLLEYSLGSERSFLWAVTQTAINSFELPKRGEIESAARTVYALLTAHNRREKGETPGTWQKRIIEARAKYAKAAPELSRMLLGPVARQLNKKRLLIVADGALQYLPFGALPVPERRGDGATGRRGDDFLFRLVSPSPRRPVAPTPLIVEHEIVNLPSVSAIAALRRELAGRKIAPLSVAVLGDPVFSIDDPRVNLAKERRGSRASVAYKPTGDIEKALRDVDETERGLSPLPFTRQEATSIIKLLPQHQGFLALDFKASKATATSSELSQYRIVHFATHGLLDSTRPELSGIVLSLVDERGTPQDGFLQLHEIYNLNLPAELVVLSSCRTGLGKEIRGEGMVGLTRGFMYAGAARLVTSLWKVDDEATAELMKRFYTKMLLEGERPAAALRAAQIEMWRQKDWQTPFYWAAFSFQGEWK
jgi:tetratricopeptide (TPR) repeat protein